MADAVRRRVYRRGAVASAVLACLALAGCAEPAHGSADYGAKAAQTALAASQAVATARLAAQLGGGNRAFDPYLDTVVTRAEQQLSATVSLFDGVQPPTPADDQLRDRLDSVLGDAQDLVAQLRIAVRRDGGSSMPPIGKELAKVADQLQPFEEPAK